MNAALARSLSASLLVLTAVAGCPGDETGGADVAGDTIDVTDPDGAEDVAEDTAPAPDAEAADTAMVGDAVHLREPPLLSNARTFTPGDGLGSVRVQPALAWVEGFRLITAWTGDDGDGGLGIWVTTLDTAGAELDVLRPPSRVDTDARGIRNEPSLCTTHNGRAVVVWSVDTQEVGPDGENLEVRFRRLDNSGLPLGDADQRVLTARPGNHWLGQVACSGSGFAVAGVRPGDPAPGFEVFVQRYDPNGAPLGAAIVPSVATFGQGFPAIAGNDLGELVVAFEDTPAGGADTVILARRLGPQGTLVTAAAVSGVDGARASVALDPGSARFAVAATFGTSPRIARFGADGALAGAVAVPEAAGAIVTNATLEPLGDDRYALVYLRGSGANVDVRLTYIDASGAIGAEATVASGSVPLAYRPTLAYRFGTLAVGWTESLGGGQYAVRGAVYRDQP